MSLRFIHPKDIKAGMSICGWIGMDALWILDVTADAVFAPLARTEGQTDNRTDVYQVRGIFRSRYGTEGTSDSVQEIDENADIVAEGEAV